MDRVLNVSAYRFVDLPDAPALCAALHARAEAAGLRGTVLLAREGINLYLAGAPEAVRGWLALLQQDTRFAGLDIKESVSHAVPFRRLRVRLRPEIIRMNRPTIRPADARAPAVSTAVLRRWLDRGHDDNDRPLRMLDTRNAFEVDAGRFEAATDWRLTRFSDFPAALERHIDSLRDCTVVSYCTGGIRCEKAALLMREAGLQRVWQLDGGILRWFEQQGGAHFVGRCFVFDEREPLAPQAHGTVGPQRPGMSGAAATQQL